MNKKILMFAIMGIFLFSFASALTYQVDNEVNLTVTCLNDGYCENTTQCNINVINPTGDLVVDGQNMTYTTNSFYYNLTNILNGEYHVTGYCLDGSLQDEINYNYEVTPNGNEMNNSQAIAYFVLLFAVVIFFLITLYAFIQLPFKNERSDDGKVLSVNDLKYLKVLFFFLSYGLLTWIANIMIEISSSLSSSSVTFGLFSMLFTVMTAALYPVMILTIIALIVLYIQDSKLNKWLNRGK